MDLSQRKNIRKPSYDYNNSGSYFITICTKNREHYFGEIYDYNMSLNDIGKYVRDCRKDIPNHFPFVEIGEFICMPDHIHGILTIKSGRDGNTARLKPITVYVNNRRGGNTAPQNDCRDGLSSVRLNISDRTKNISSLHGAVSGSLGSIVRGFKIGVTKYANQNNIPFARQSRFYDHIIANEIEYYFIEQYIKNNPKNRQ